MPFAVLLGCVEVARRGDAEHRSHDVVYPRRPSENRGGVGEIGTRGSETTRDG